MGYTSHLEGLLQQKKEEITLLEGRTSAYTARISMLQTRLLTTLDTLDAVQNAHAQEISIMNRKIDHMQEKMHRYNEVVKLAELERDDMRDAVLKLVEKVESSNDYSTWPHSQIYLSSLQDPFPEPTIKRDKTSEEEELLSYAASVIDSLRLQRDSARKSYSRGRAIAEVRILALEAQLSRREAELESCSGHADHRPTDQLLMDQQETLRDEPMTSAQIISLLDVTVARNKVLEAEVKALAKRLENARATHPSNQSNMPTPALSLQKARRNESERNVDIVVTSSEGHIQLRPWEGGGTSNRKNTDSHRDTDHHTLRELDRQIRELADKIDTFTEERQILLQTLVPNVPIPPLENETIDMYQNTEPGDRLKILEGECDRLRQLERDLRHQLEATRSNARAREDELLQEISSLRLDQDETERVPNDVDDNDGEMSMELATPLMPTSLLSAQPISRTISPAVADNVGSPYVYPPMIPLPPSPDDEPDDISLPLSDIMANGELSPRNGPPEADVELRRVEAELVDTQRHIEAGEAALDHLEDLVDELHS